MIKIKFYTSDFEDKVKIFCKKSEEYYYSTNRVLVIVNNKDHLYELDKSLWTYSQKHFIPHATINDPYPHRQPILITTEFKNLNNANTIFLINPTKEIILTNFNIDLSNFFSQIEKLVFILDSNCIIPTMEIIKILKTSKFPYSLDNI